MQIIPSGVQRLLVKLPTTASSGNLFQPGSASSSLFRPLGQNGAGLGAAPLSHPGPGYKWHEVMPLSAATTMNPWDAAHDLSRRVKADTGADAYVEPDFLQQPPLPDRALTLEALDGLICQASEYNQDWGATDGLLFGWHLGPQFSGLKAAREAVGDRLSLNGRRVRIGHLDTGYDPNHISLPMRLHPEMAWNFVDNNNSAVAPMSAGGLLPDPSHGTGTLGLLAGKQIPELGGDFLGGAPYADIVPVRIGNTYLQLWSSALSGGIDHAVGCGCDVISLSAGGIPAQSWADAVNRAYEAGCCIFAASGDSIGGIPTHLTIYPARFNRVVSVCGVTNLGRTYFNDQYFLTKRIEGSWGPRSAMATAISAYAPNVPWAKQGCSKIFDKDGGGTSAATPQAAAAGALWLQMHLDALDGAQPWQRVEAIRYALYTSAGRVTDFDHLGRGTLRAADALRIGYDPAKIQKVPPDDIAFALFKELFGFPSLLMSADLASGIGVSVAQQHMLEIEALQLIATSPQLARIVGDADLAQDALASGTRSSLIAGMIASPATSRSLRAFLVAAAQKLRAPAVPG